MALTLKRLWKRRTADAIEVTEDEARKAMAVLAGPPIVWYRVLLQDRETFTLTGMQGLNFNLGSSRVLGTPYTKLVVEVKGNQVEVRVQEY